MDVVHCSAGLRCSKCGVRDDSDWYRIAVQLVGGLYR